MPGSRTDVRRLGRLPTATGAIARLAYAQARQSGIEVAPLLEKAKLTERQIKDRAARINVRHQIQFLNLVADSVGDDFLGFHLAQIPDLRSLGLIYYVAASSETLGDALRRGTRYASIANEGLVIRQQEDKQFRVMFDYIGVTRYVDRHQIEFFMTILIRLCRRLTGMQLMPCYLKLTHPRTQGSPDFARYFGGDVEFASAVDEIAFAPAIMDTALASADPYLNELLLSSCHVAMNHRPAHGGPFRSAVENAIVPLLPHGRATAAQVARKLGLSQRTAARRLSLEGLTFSTVLKSLRDELAQQYLSEPGLSISRIAWLLGYQEVSAFTHAFKRWTGKTPREARMRPPIVVQSKHASLSGAA